jgi:FkbM family methyltransferase
MLKLITSIGKFLNHNFKKKLRKLYFNKVISLIEDIFWKSEVYFEGILLTKNKEIMTPEIKSLIRTKLYEKNEMLAIEKLQMYGEDLIDLGSSIGLTSLKVVQNTNNKKIVLVEPILEYLNYSKIQLEAFKDNSYFYENKAIDYSKENKFIDRDVNNLLIKLSDNGGQKVTKITISEILKKYSIKTYNLIIDIEGNSFDPLFYEETALKNCKKMIIEDNFDKYSKSEIEDRIIELDFNIDFYIPSKYGNVLGIKNNKLL